MRSIKLSLAVMAVLAMGATTAQATPVTVGSALTGPFDQGEATTGSGTFINLSLGELGTRVVSPVSGAVIRWSVIKAAGPFRLRVLRPAGGAAYTAVASSGISTATGPGGVETFSTAVPIQAGDAIGLDINNGNKIGIASEDPADVAAVWIPPIADGATAPFVGSEDEIEVGFNAVVQPAPTLAGIAPASGSIKGGSAVSIIGTDFAGVSGVSFGGLPAAFTVGSEGQITATSPPGKRGTVDVTVTTIAGTTAAAKFTYEGCVVPQLRGKKLKAAKKKLRKAGCKPGKVSLRGDTTAKAGKVVKQSRKAGKQLGAGTKVNITLG